VCDRSAAWEHGTVVALRTMPSYWDYNTVRVEGADPGIGAAELLAAVERLQAGLAHRRVEFDDPAAGARLQGALEAAGYVCERLAWMRRAGPPPPAAPGVDEVAFADTRELRARWHRGEDWSGEDPAVLHFLAHQDAVAARRGLRAFVVKDAGEPVAFASLLAPAGADAVEVEQVFVAPDRRGAGLGARVIAGALAAGGRALAWVVADEDGRPKRLYGRLGFAPVWLQYAFVRYPDSHRPPA
jgi:GNAT superfamily N-acetyltransferase